MMKARIAIAFAAVVLAGCAPSKEKGPGPPALARVNGAPVSVSQFQESLRFLKLGFSNVSGKTNGADAKMDLLSQLIEEEMYLQEASKLGIEASGKEIDAGYEKAIAGYPGDFKKTLKQAGLSGEAFREKIRKKLIIEKLIDREVYSKIKVERAAEEDYFKKQRGRFSRPAMVRARQIVVDGRAEAEKILAGLKKGADFASLARQKSLSPDSARGGDLGWFSRDQMPPEFGAAVFRLRPGQTSGIIKTPYGYHIFKVEDASEAAAPSFQEAQPEIRRHLAAKQGEDEFVKWGAGLKARTKVDVDFGLLGSL